MIPNLELLVLLLDRGQTALQQRIKYSDLSGAEHQTSSRIQTVRHVPRFKMLNSLDVIRMQSFTA
jgi:hypothetical protein